MLKNWIKPTLVIIFLSFITACQSGRPAISAPLNDRAALEKLSTAYKNRANTLAVSPTLLDAAQRRRFVALVFQDAGYDYTATLVSLSQISPSEIHTLHKDLKDLLFLPHYGLEFDQVKSIYSQQEQSAIDVIKRNFSTH